MDMFEALAAPFPADAVSWRVGSTNGDKTKGMALAFIDARDVMERLDAVCGPAGWQCRYPHANGKTVCDVGIKVGDEWVWKADGAGDSDVEAEKGALSDAFKRAAVRWGVGRYLYHLASPWVAIEAKGRSHFITDEAKVSLRKLLTREGAPATQEKPKEPDLPPEESGLFIALKAAMDICDGEAALRGWLDSNTDSLAKIADERPDVYAAARRYYSKRLKDSTQKVAA